MAKDTNITDFEFKLIQLLSQNARAPVRRIAQLMKVSEATVRYHISKLERNGVITGYSVIINPDKLHLPIFITVGVECEPALTKRVAEAIAQSPYFYLVWVVTGAHNIHAKGVFPSAEEMQRIVGDLMSKTEGITSYHLSLRFEAVKEPYLLPQDLFATIKQQRVKG
ncbi:MAG: Lrp/AsnC family transcriptional regulator [Candidatus Hodarchaeota archaeon]